MPPKKRQESNTSHRRRPATTPEAREQQMISLADALAEKQLRDGTASAQVITHFLKLGTSREKLEQEKIRRENKLRQVQIDQIANAAQSDEMYRQALEAMRRYGGHDTGDEV